MLLTSIPCRFCGTPASFIDRYACPFLEDQKIFQESMNLYWCPRESLGFACPMPTREALARYYKEIYRSNLRLYSEDPHAPYRIFKQTPLADSQYTYLSQFIDFKEIRTVIDMGCGHGLLLRKFQERYPNIRLIGIDLDPDVRHSLKEIGAEFLHASADDIVKDICRNISHDTLLISSHTLHLQRDNTFIRDIISETKKAGTSNVFLFIEVTNDALNQPGYVQSRVYDVPKLIFFTLDSFRKGIFDLEIINLVTNGWLLEQEIFFRKRRLEKYQRGKRHRVVSKILRMGKSLVPAQLRMVMRGVLGGGGVADTLPYYAYGGNRRAIRLLGKIR